MLFCARWLAPKGNVPFRLGQYYTSTDPADPQRDIAAMIAAGTQVRSAEEGTEGRSAEEGEGGAREAETVDPGDEDGGEPLDHLNLDALLDEH